MYESKSIPDHLHLNLVGVIIRLVVSLVLLLRVCSEVHAYDDLISGIGGLV